MLPGTKKADTTRKVVDYIGHRLEGDNKMISAQKAGYSVETSKKPGLIEHTKAYQSIVEQILTENASIMLWLSSSIHNDIKEGKLDDLKPVEKGQLYKIITDTNDKLIPKVTLKESTDKNGNVTRTAWAQNASQVQEVMTNEE